MQTESVTGSKNEANKLLTSFASQLYALLDVKASSLISAMEDRIKHDQKQIELLEKKQSALSAAYNEYLDIHSQIRAHEQSIEKITGLVGEGLFGSSAMFQPDSQYEADRQQRVGALRKSLQLWEAIEMYLRFVPDRESKVRDILDFLEAIEFECSRQSVEAAIKAHPKVFRVAKRKNEKFISLKGV